ncbi:TonB-dependent siderophore receptor [Pseudomonas helleri]|uniref:TonB-dependent siderophore receptor n=1 Tax=Pseudomonas helleri TaxID=1608996 RepID=A0A6A7Z6S1_9PSED|nr:TonB-dependent siderophore receptor [Pseudomonas helleri]MQT34304.1 TonB-dependent siderophore receptor [Pseudomonas helleri]MQU19835.1 TonB-dependent siderophore receptor [Pseudomonas helleri]MQU42139.1 TonB-dependent siderophore receptor [Pseudomonas helleri]MQU58181.1 TonB-dependent siderophore receptor [Pseudomonas helleri]
MLNPWPHTRYAAVALAALANPAWVQAQEVNFNVPAGPLATTLNAIASQSGHIVSLEPGLVQGKQAPAVIGQMSPEHAMEAALRGSGLQLRITAQGSFSVEPAPHDAQALQLGVTSITERSLDATTEGSGSYSARAVTIGKGAHSLKETPQSITVMTRKMLDDQNLNTIEQVMEKTPGITVYDSPMGGKYFYSRGFRMTGQYQYDGVPLDIGSSYVQADSFNSDMAIYDRVEVLRGAAGMMKGAGGTSGGVNFVRKRGEYTPHTQLSLSAGTWDNYRGQIDTGGPLNDTGSVRGRAVITEQTRQYFYDVGQRKDQIYYGALDIDLSPDTTLGIGLAYEDVDATPCWGGLPRYADGSDLKLKRSTCLNPAWNHQRSKRTTWFGDLKHQLNDDWAVKVAGVYSKNTQDMEYAFPSGSVPVSATQSNTLVIGSTYEYDQVDYGFDAYLNGTFDAFGQQHELTVGANASRSRKDDFFAVAVLPDRQDVFNPNHHLPQPDDSYYLANATRGGPMDMRIKQYGAYSIARLKLAEPLTLVVGSRVSWYSSNSDSVSYWRGEGTPVHTQAKETGQVTPFAAVLFDLNDNLTAYASYTDIFTPQGNYRTLSGATLKPLIGQSYEVGIKGEWFDGRLNSAFNLFRTIQKDAAQDDPLCPDSSCSQNSGKVRAQGFEAEVSGEVIDRLQLLAGYTYTQTKVLEDADAAQNGVPYNSYVPRHLLRVWADYGLSGALDRVSVGVGVNAQSSNYRVSPISGNDMTQSGYAVWNGRVSYRIDDTWSVALNGNNLFDKRYYVTVGTEGFGNFYGEPRNFVMSLKADF